MFHVKHPWTGDADPARPLTADAVRTISGADPAAVDFMARHLDLLRRWQPRINLVGRSTLADPWRRHVLDSLQLMPLLPTAAAPIVDLGSGAGFPGMVLALAGAGEVHLVESDSRKAAFLRQVKAETGAAATIHAVRAEALAAFPAGVVTARALAPLDRLLGLAEPFIGPRTVCLFLKGNTAEEELTLCGKRWKMRATRVDSLTDPAGTILKLEGICRHGLGHRTDD